MRKITERLFSGLLSVTLAAAFPIVGNAADGLKYGDIDGDSSINSVDALAVLNHSGGFASLRRMLLRGRTSMRTAGWILPMRSIFSDILSV